MYDSIKSGLNLLPRLGIAAELAGVFKKITRFPVGYCSADMRTGHFLRGGTPPHSSVDAAFVGAGAQGATDELLGNETKTRSKRGPAPKLQQQVELLAQLPKAQQRLVMQMLDGVLAQQGR